MSRSFFFWCFGSMMGATKAPRFLFSLLFVCKQAPIPPDSPANKNKKKKRKKKKKKKVKKRLKV